MKGLNNKAFTLIETILTTLLLGIGLMGSLSLLQSSTATSFENNARVTGSQLAQEKLEAVIADKTFKGYSAINTASYPAELPLPTPYNKYNRTTTVTEVSGSDLQTAQAGSGFKKVDVAVSWGNQGYETVTVSTLVSNY
jgi:type II secretory pathway pseudopilin PulG